MSSPRTQNPFTRRGFVVAAVVIALIVVAAIAALITSMLRPGSDRADAAPAATPSPAVSETAGPTAAPLDAAPSVCGLPAFEVQSSLDAAPNNQWELVGTVAAPVDPAVGPGVVDGPFRSCFAHTAEGAVFAAVNYLAAGTDARNASRLWQLIAPGPQRNEIQAKSASGAATAGPDSSRVQVVGFSIDNYTATDATVDLALRYSTGAVPLVSAPIVMTWAEGDWKVVFSDSGPVIAPGALSNLGGYIPWSGA